MKEFLEKFKVNELQIFGVDQWIVSLRPQQITLGTLILSLNRPCDNIGDLTENESKSLGLAFKAIKELYSNTFKPEKVNYLLLMMVDQQVHFHVIPRYESEIEYEGKYYKDEAWPKPANIFSPLDISSEELFRLKEFLKTNINKDLV